MKGWHFVYFIGGPLDLTKRAFPGDTPASRYLTFPVYSDRAVFYGPDDQVPIDEEGRMIRTPPTGVTYSLSPAYRPGSLEPVAWVGTVK